VPRVTKREPEMTALHHPVEKALKVRFQQVAAGLGLTDKQALARAMRDWIDRNSVAAGFKK
jgi:hypothetical protein